jgi:hypothetical protein
VIVGTTGGEWKLRLPERGVPLPHAGFAQRKPRLGNRLEASPARR